MCHLNRSSEEASRYLQLQHSQVSIFIWALQAALGISEAAFKYSSRDLSDRLTSTIAHEIHHDR